MLLLVDQAVAHFRMHWAVFEYWQQVQVHEFSLRKHELDVSVIIAGVVRTDRAVQEVNAVISVKNSHINES